MVIHSKILSVCATEALKNVPSSLFAPFFTITFYTKQNVKGSAVILFYNPKALLPSLPVIESQQILANP